MATYILRRLLLMFPTLLGMTALVFFVMALSPGGIGGALLAQRGAARGADTAKVRAYYAKRYGPDQPAPVQYARWLNQISPVGFAATDDGSLGAFGFKRPSLGESQYRHRPVGDLVAESLPLTLVLNLLSIPIIYGVGVLGGIRAARHRGTAFDTGFGAAQLAAWSVPTIWVGVLLIGFLANVEYVRWFPTGGLVEREATAMPFLPHIGPDGTWDRGWLADVAWHLALPVFCLTLGASGFVTKLVRGSVLENLAADYARTARSKGLAENVVLYRHVFRNSLLSLITVAASLLPAMIAGSIVIETIFSIPGMGRLGVDGARFQDREVVLGVTLIGGVLSLASALLRDVLYALADPRVSYE